jgi:hypothetical protein
VIAIVMMAVIGTDGTEIVVDPTDRIPGRMEIVMTGVQEEVTGTAPTEVIETAGNVETVQTVAVATSSSSRAGSLLTS